jgi:hypothetical protein
MYAIQKTVMTLLLLVATAAFATVSVADGGSASKAAPMKFVGTYYGLSGSVVSFHSDGTMSSVGAAMFSDNPTTVYGGRKVTPHQGVWRVVGDNTIRQTNMFFLTEAFGHNYEPDGVIVKQTWEAVFDKSVQGRSPGYHIDAVTTEIFLPDQNPITDEPLQVIETPFDGRGLRLEVE